MCAGCAHSLADRPFPRTAAHLARRLRPAPTVPFSSSSDQVSLSPEVFLFTFTTLDGSFSPDRARRSCPFGGREVEKVMGSREGRRESCSLELRSSWCLEHFMRIFVVVISLSTKDNLRPRSAGGVLKYFGTLLLWFVSVSLLFFFCLTDLTACVCVTRCIPLVVPVQWCRTIFIFRVLERSNFRSNTQAGPKWVPAGLLQHTHAVRAASFSIFKSLQHFSGPPIGGVCAECWKDCFTLRPACTRASALLGPWQARCHSLASISYP